MTDDPNRDLEDRPDEPDTAVPASDSSGESKSPEEVRAALRAKLLAATGKKKSPASASGEAEAVPSAHVAEPGDGLTEDTSPSEVLEDPPASASGPTPFVMRGIADLEAEAVKSGQFDAVSQSGQFQPASRSGETPAGPQPGQVPLVAASQSGQFAAAAAESGQFVAARPLSASGVEDETAPGLQIPTGPPPADPTRPIPFEQVSQSSERPAAPAAQSQGSAEFPFAHVNQPKEPPKGIVRRLGPTLAAGVGFFLVVVWVIVSQWVPPTTALMFMAAGMLVPTGAVALATSQHSPRNIVVRLLPALILGAGAMVAAWAWGMVEIRAQAVAFAPDQIRSMEKMFADQDLTLSVAACRRYAAHYQDPAWWNALFEVLNNRPELATKCLEDMPKEAADMIGGALSDRWTGELVSETKPPAEARACAVANGLAHLPVPPEESSSRLLLCNHIGETPEVQTCCGRALHKAVKSEEELAKQIPGMIASSKPESKVGSAIFNMAFHGQGLTPPQVELRDAVKFNSFIVQAMALDEACKAIPQKQHNVVDHLRAAVDQHCKLSVEQMPKDSKQWGAICVQAVREVKAGNGLDPMSTVCSLATNASVPDAMAEAVRLVERAVPLADQPQP